eukprot:CAMPEP_0201591944 /NCGR_PEP_ID=MMETSP0190_2-20130828/189973_1 /ASSEMBLY_ACC=CAM_ASM_000263 /TAXON_ID=37353 /ORGANISM="Rosalina sp." /LENGTH=178 /DNA_ID=CAMNT_0048050489 /DNA_START=145 /DNA_END=684 /DNA_ORIENTATION=+
MNECQFTHTYIEDEGEDIPTYQLSTCTADHGIIHGKFKSECGNGKAEDDNEFYLGEQGYQSFAWKLGDINPCCQRTNLNIKPNPENGLGDTILVCGREEEVIKVTQTVLGANCNGDGVSDLQLFGSYNPISTACDGQRICDGSMIKDWKNAFDPQLCDEAELDIEFVCYYDFDNEDNR